MHLKSDWLLYRTKYTKQNVLCHLKKIMIFFGSSVLLHYYYIMSTRQVEICSHDPSGPFYDQLKISFFIYVI